MDPFCPFPPLLLHFCTLTSCFFHADPSCLADSRNIFAENRTSLSRVLSRGLFPDRPGKEGQALLDAVAFQREVQGAHHSLICSMLTPSAAASFSRVVFRNFFSPDSMCDRAARVIPIFSATSFCVKPRYSRQARTNVHPLSMVSQTTSLGTLSPSSGMKGRLNLTYSWLEALSLQK